MQPLRRETRLSPLLFSPRRPDRTTYSTTHHLVTDPLFSNSISWFLPCTFNYCQAKKVPFSSAQYRSTSVNKWTLGGNLSTARPFIIFLYFFTPSRWQHHSDDPPSLDSPIFSYSFLWFSCGTINYDLTEWFPFLLLYSIIVVRLFCGIVDVAPPCICCKAQSFHELYLIWRLPAKPTIKRGV